MSDDKSIDSAVHDAQKHLKLLNEYNGDLSKAIIDVENSAEETQQKIDETFRQIRTQILKLLEAKQTQLLHNVKTAKSKNITPLQQCKTVIESEITKIENYIDLGLKLLNNEKCDKTSLQFETDSSMLGVLPAIPTLDELPNISFQCYVDDLVLDFEKKVNNIGNVSDRGPIQITESEEKPGGLLLSWCELDDEKPIDIQAYKLQQAFGNLISNSNADSNFKDCYIGPDTEFLVKNLCPNESYTFRVCCLIDIGCERRVWSAWSRPFLGSTKLEPFMWELSTKYFKVTNNNKVATKISNERAIIYSKLAQFYPHCTVQFNFLECGIPDKDQCIGLLEYIEGEERDSKTLIRPGSFVLSTTGQLYIDGQEKLTKLPKITTYSKVMFSSELKPPNRLRITVEHVNKTVTYDWTLNDPAFPLIFAACLDGKSWKLAVE